MAESCFKRFPYASAVSMILTCLGVGLFCGFFYEGVTDTQNILRNKLGVSVQVDWVAAVKLALVVAASVMAAFAVILFAFGFLATGSTRTSLYSKERCVIGGRCCAAFLLILTYLFNMVWTFVVSLLCIPVIVLVMMRSICSAELTNSRYQSGEGGTNIFCLDLTRFGLYFANSTSSTIPATRAATPICYAGDIRDICSWVNKDIPLFGVAFGGCYLMVLGLVTFLMTIGANYQRIKSTRELSDFRRAIDGDVVELDRMIADSSSRPTFRAHSTFSMN